VGLHGGGRRKPSSGEQAGRPGQCAGGQAQGGRGKGLEVFSRPGIGAGRRAHRGVPMAGRRPVRRRARQETGDLYSGHKAVGKDVSYAPRQQVAAWVACTDGVAAEYGDVASGGRRHGRRDVATTRVTRGARRRGVVGGAAQGAGSTVRGPADRGQPRRAGPVGPCHERRANAGASTALERQGQNSSNWHALTLFFSKKLNCSGLTLEYQSCRSLDPLQLLQRAYGLFLIRLCTICKQSLLFSGRL
jgi:hypothetical protein